jgi:hypothetical protein
MAAFYAFKVRAAGTILFQRGTTNSLDAKMVETRLQLSVDAFARLTALTTNTYQFANSMQTSHRKIPFVGASHAGPTNYLWSQVLPLYQNELADIRAQIAAGKPVLPAAKKPASINRANPEMAEPQ